MVDLGTGSVVLLVVAGFVAGAVNAVAGGGSLVSFPALLAVGYPSVTANITNQVAVLPGYVGGSVAYRAELGGQGPRLLALSVTSALGALVGAALLVVSPPAVFDVVVPYLILLACAMLAAQPAISRRVSPAGGAGEAASPRLHLMTLAGSVYGGYFGAGLGIMLLAVLALGLADTLQRLNALKGLLSLVVGVAAVAFFAVFESVAWGTAAIMAVTTYAGGQVGVALARRLSATLLRAIIVAFGVGMALWLLVSG